ARKQFEKEPKSFGNKRNRITDAHRAWVEQRYRDGWAKGYADEHVKIFRNEEFAYHKVSVVFWQTDENDRPALITEPYEKAFTAANLAKEHDFYCREPVLLPDGDASANPSPTGAKDNSPGQGSAATAALGKPPHNKNSLS